MRQGFTGGGYERIGVAHARGMPRISGSGTGLRGNGSAPDRTEACNAYLIRFQPYADHLPAVFGFGRHGDLLALGGKHAPTAFAARVSLVLAGAHFGMLEAKAGHFRREFDDRLLPLAGSFGDAPVLAVGRQHDRGSGS